MTAALAYLVADFLKWGNFLKQLDNSSKKKRGIPVNNI